MCLTNQTLLPTPLLGYLIAILISLAKIVIRKSIMKPSFHHFHLAKVITRVSKLYDLRSSFRGSKIENFPGGGGECLSVLCH